MKTKLLSKIMWKTLTVLLLLCGVNFTNAQTKWAKDEWGRTNPNFNINKEEQMTVKGAFSYLGNTLMVGYKDGQPYDAPDGDNWYHIMKYVDVDNDPNTFNSSSAELILALDTPDENGKYLDNQREYKPESTSVSSAVKSS